MTEQNELPINPKLMAFRVSPAALRGVYALGKGYYEGKVFRYERIAGGDLRNAEGMALYYNIMDTTEEGEMVAGLGVDSPESERLERPVLIERMFGLWFEYHNLDTAQIRVAIITNGEGNYGKI